MEVIEEIWLFNKNVELYFAESHAEMLKLSELTCVFCIHYPVSKFSTFNQFSLFFPDFYTQKIFEF